MRTITTMALIALALATTACEDESGVAMDPSGEVNGTWVVQRAAGTTYVRILPSTVELYVEGDTCFERTRYQITAIDGPQFSLVAEEAGTPASWSFERVGDALAVTMGTEALTLEAISLDVNALKICGGPDPDFPNPGCANIPVVGVGESLTGALGDGDAQWTDDTWYDLWSLQLAAPATVTITMTSDDQDLLDPYMLFYDATGVERIDENDDIDYDGGNYNSRVGPIDLEAGCYIIVAGSWQGDDDGEVGAGYTISVQ